MAGSPYSLLKKYLVEPSDAEIAAMQNPPPNLMAGLGDVSANFGRRPAAAPALNMAPPLAEQVKRAAAPVTPKAKGSGLMEMSEAQGTQKTQSTSQKPVFADPADLEPLMGFFRNLPEVKELQAGQERSKQLLAMGLDANKPQLDLNPLMVLADAWGPKGSRNAATYRAPANDGYKTVLAYNEKIQDNQRDAAKTLIDAVKSAKAGIDTQQLLTQITSKVGQKAADPAAATRAGGGGAPQQASYDRELRQNLDKLSTNVTSHKQQLDLLDTAVKSKKYDQVASILAQFARGISGERGVLTEGDISRTMPRNWQGDLAKLQAYFNDRPTADLDPAYVKGLLEMAKIARANTYSMFKEQIGTKKNLYSNSPYYGGNAKRNLEGLEQLVERFQNAPMDEKEAIRQKMKAIEKKLGIGGK